MSTTTEARAPRLTLDADGAYRTGNLRLLTYPGSDVETSVTVYRSDGHLKDRASLAIGVGPFRFQASCRTEQLREFAALLNETADLIDMLGRLEPSPEASA